MLISYLRAMTNSSNLIYENRCLDKIKHWVKFGTTVEFRVTSDTNYILTASWVWTLIISKLISVRRYSELHCSVSDINGILLSIFAIIAPKWPQFLGCHWQLDYYFITRSGLSVTVLEKNCPRRLPLVKNFYSDKRTTDQWSGASFE